MDPRFRTYGYPAATVLIALWIVMIALPVGWKSWAPDFLNPSLHLGLDLQGGTQLDFRISEAEMQNQIAQLRTEIAALESAEGSEAEIADKRAQISNIEYQRQNIVEAIRTVLERRVNALGVSEAVITPSYYGAEKHFLVECPGVVEVQQCISAIGKTILLEFKEQFEGEDESHIASMRALAERAYSRITNSGETLGTVGQDMGSALGVFYSDEMPFYRDELPESMADVWSRTMDSPILMREVSLGSVPVGEETIENRGIMLVEVTSEKVDTERTLSDPVAAMTALAESEEKITVQKHTSEDPAKMDAGVRTAMGENTSVGTLLKAETTTKQPVVLLVTSYTEPVETIAASHILISYQGAVRAEPTVTRTKERAEQLAREVIKRVQDGENFAVLAQELSDGPSADDAGSLGEFGRGEMALAFEHAAWDLNVGDVTGPVETEFGYHIIRKDRGVQTKPGSIDYTELVFTGENAAMLQNDVFTKLQNRAVTKTEPQMKLRTLFFSF